MAANDVIVLWFSADIHSNRMWKQRASLDGTMHMSLSINVPVVNEVIPLRLRTLLPWRPMMSSFCDFPQTSTQID